MYGSPKKSSMQAHDPAPFCCLQTAFDPHGDGLQGSEGSSTGGAKFCEEIKLVSYFFKLS